MGKNWFVVETTKSCDLICVCCYPSCVEVIVEVVFEFVGIPLSVEVIEVGVLAFMPIPLSVEVIVVWLCALSL